MKFIKVFKLIKEFGIKATRVIADELERGDRIHREVESRKAMAHQSFMNRGLFLK